MLYEDVARAVKAERQFRELAEVHESTRERLEYECDALRERIAGLKAALREAMRRHQSTIESEWSPGNTDADWRRDCEFKDLYEILDGTP